MNTSDTRRARLGKWFENRTIPPKEKSYISQLLSGTAPFGERAARRLERDYGMGHLYLDGIDKPEVSLITAVGKGEAAPDGFVKIPESKIEFSAGNGRTAQYELVTDEEPATYRLDWFQKYGINPDRVRRFRVAGDSMEPLLYPRDTILVNLAETNIIDGKLYAIRYGDELRVKYLRRLLDGTLILHSVNPLYEDEKIPSDLAAEHISIIGRVRDRSGTGGL